MQCGLYCSFDFLTVIRFTTANLLDDKIDLV